MSRIRPFKVYRKRRDYSFLKLLMVIPVIFVGLCAHFFMMDQDLPFLGNSVSDFLVIACTFISFILIFVFSIRLMSRNDKAARSGINYQRQSLFKNIVSIFFIIVFSLIIAALNTFLLHSVYKSTLGYITTLGALKQQTVQLQANIIKNPEFEKVIAVPAHKGNRNIVEPSTYKIFPVIWIQDEKHEIPVHCYIGNEVPQLKSTQFNMMARQSFMGFLCIEHCSLSEQFKTPSSDTIAPDQLLECNELYKKQPSTKTPKQ